MKISNKALIADLLDRTQANLNVTTGFINLDANTLNTKPTPDSWSILECIEHLNRYGDFYLPEIDHRIKTGIKADANAVFKSGWLGNYFAESLKPKENLNKMKTFRDMDPINSLLHASTLTKFVDQQKQMIQLLNRAIPIDLTRTKTSISISNWIKLRLGDTLKVVIYHNERHIEQAKRVLAGVA